LNGPLIVNCWPSPTGDGTTEVNIEYELESDGLTLHGLTISIPLPGGFPSVTSHTGTYSVDPSSSALVWSIPLVSSSENRSGSLEFTVDGDDASAFFPVKVDFAAEGSLVGVKIANVYKPDSEDEAVFSQEAICTTDEYLVV
jgi:coatomer subunit delta